jgi:outer membrane protein TolC
MLRRWSLSWLAIAGLLSCARSARADDARATIAVRAYTLDECVSLAEQNFPQLWAARARLEYAHAQLDEARWTPYFQWSAQGQLGVAPPLLGSVLYPQSALGPSTQASRNITSLQGLQPFASFSLNGVFPLWTFGKIDAAAGAAEANVRVSEWDMERWRQQTRSDVRRAYYHLQSARDSKYLLTDALDRLGKAIDGMRDRIARGDRNVSETDRLRLEVFRQDVTVQSLQADRYEAHDLASLHFFTGVQTRFDVVDEPLKLPDRPLGPIVQYMESARLSRGDVNMARAGVIARRAWADYNRAKLFPDVGLGLGAGFVSTPSAVSQQNLWANDPYNYFGYVVAFGLRWSLDLLPQAARTRASESQLAETRSLEDLAMGNAMWEVEKAYADAVEAKRREETWERAEHVAKEWLADVQGHIDVGTSDERALLEPLRSYGSARAQHVTALLDYNVAMSNLVLASGLDAAAPSRAGP